MRITVRFFAMLRDAIDGGEMQEIDLPTDADVAAAVACLAGRFPRLSVHLSSVATAVNRAYASRDHVLADGDELALIPPVSGG